MFGKKDIIESDFALRESVRTLLEDVKYLKGDVERLERLLRLQTFIDNPQLFACGTEKARYTIDLGNGFGRELKHRSAGYSVNDTVKYTAAPDKKGGKK